MSFLIGQRLPSRSRVRVSVQAATATTTLILVTHLISAHGLTEISRPPLRRPEITQNTHENDDSITTRTTHTHRHRLRHPESLHSCGLAVGHAEGNATSLEKCSARTNNLIGISLKELRCKPRPQIVQLRLPGPNYDLNPSVAIVNRCGGNCRPSASCLPTKVSTKEILVHQIDRSRLGAGGSGGFRPECAVVNLEEHDECRCGCEIQPHHCNSNQMYDHGSCSCICTNFDEKYECEKHRHERLAKSGSVLAPMELRFPQKKWNPSTCTCSCVHDKAGDGDENNNCPNDLMWVPKLCRCVRLPASDAPSPDSGAEDVNNVEPIEHKSNSIDDIDIANLI